MRYLSASESGTHLFLGGLLLLLLLRPPHLVLGHLCGRHGEFGVGWLLVNLFENDDGFDFCVTSWKTM